ncbi:MAG: bifunctional UDP-N-acetylglucosamine diphosphorylase/glucosamine-1-phosphate N-acetyltransferase GlmU [Desulfomicrobium sp.]|nr:bifunctional UDP-N-acetylglucosamine diphosphorylase/glucosamine-1-phosphate N-acetyltransferase GlmU [Desulfomicrobium sp.]
MNPSIGYVILAAGKGTRMHSSSPKVLQTVLGKPLLGHVYTQLGHVPQALVWTVVGYGADQVGTMFTERQSGFVYQHNQLGTGHAIQLAWPQIVASGVTHVCVINGDTPLVPVTEIEALVLQCSTAQAGMGVLTTILDNPFGYGRIIRNSTGNIQAIVEEKDCQQEKDIHEVNTGVYIFDVTQCTPLLGSLNCDNQQNEYYLTQMVSLCTEQGCAVVGLALQKNTFLRGINSPQELVAYEESLRDQIVAQHQRAGVIIRWNQSVVIGPDVTIEPGVEISGPTEIYGQTHLAAGTHIESHCWIKDSILRACHVKSFSHIDSSQIMAGTTIGPFARIRPGTTIHQNARVGNFVEIKKSTLQAGAKAGHLSYLGDCEVGQDANIGAGTITCNYDGAAKHRTIIRDQAFIGSNTALVAPLTIGKKVVVGAGSVVTKNVPDNMLCVARAKQVNIDRMKKKSQTGE